MQRPFMSKMHPLTQLVFVGLLVIVSLILSLILAFLVGIVFFSMDAMTNAMSGLLNNVAVLKFIQITQSLGMFVLPPILAGWFLSKDTFAFLQMRNKQNVNWLTLGLVFVITIVFLPIIDYTGFLNQNMHLPEFMHTLEVWMREKEDLAKILTEKFANVHTMGGLVINILMIGVIAALGEEMLFRGVFQPLLGRWLKNSHAAVWITAFLFSAMHLQFYGFIPRLILGAYMGYLLVWSGSLWLSVFAHFVNNTLGVILYYLFYNGMIKQNPESLGYEGELWLVVLSMFVLTTCIYYLRRKVLKPCDVL